MIKIVVNNKYYIKIIICDEIGDDADAVEQCLFSGVRVVAAVHAGSRAELSRRKGAAQLLPLFDKAAVLAGAGALAELWECGGAT